MAFIKDVILIGMTLVMSMSTGFNAVDMNKVYAERVAEQVVTEYLGIVDGVYPAMPDTGDEKIEFNEGVPLDLSHVRALHNLVLGFLNR